MRKLTTALVLSLVFLTSLTRADAPAPDIEGSYSVRGTGVHGSAYEATATIRADGDTYLIDWKFTDGGFHGVAIREGDTLAVGWSNNGKPGVVLYHVHGDTLDGKWSDGSDSGKVYTETLTKQP
jgi:hypothetical protein